MSFKIIKEDGTGAILAENTDGLKVEMISKNITGNIYFHVFESDSSPGVFVEEECTQMQYEALAQPGWTVPIMSGHTWQHSYSDWAYDTPSRRLEDGCYVTNEGKHYVKLPGLAQQCVTTI